MNGTVVSIRYKKVEDLASNIMLAKTYAFEEHGKIDEEESGPGGLGINDEPIDKLTVWFVSLWGAIWFTNKVIATMLSDIYDIRFIGDGPEYDKQAYSFACREQTTKEA